jgi:hypothetical protein
VALNQLYLELLYSCKGNNLQKLVSNYIIIQLESAFPPFSLEPTSATSMSEPVLEVFPDFDFFGGETPEASPSVPFRARLRFRIGDGVMFKLKIFIKYRVNFDICEASYSFG